MKFISSIYFEFNHSVWNSTKASSGPANLFLLFLRLGFDLIICRILQLDNDFVTVRQAGDFFVVLFSETLSRGQKCERSAWKRWEEQRNNFIIKTNEEKSWNPYQRNLDCIRLLIYQSQIRRVEALSFKEVHLQFFFLLYDLGNPLNLTLKCV